MNDFWEYLDWLDSNEESKWVLPREYFLDFAESCLLHGMSSYGDFTQIIHHPDFSVSFTFRDKRYRVEKGYSSWDDKEPVIIRWNTLICEE